MGQDDIDARATTVSPEEAAERLGLKVSTLSNLRWRGEGPTYCKVAGKVRYRLVDLAEYLDSRARRSTSAPGAPINGRRAAKEE